MVFFVARFGGTFSVLDGPAAVLRVVRAVARDFGGGFAGVMGPSDRSLRREGSDGRGSAGAFRFGGIMGREMTRDSKSRVLMMLWAMIEFNAS